MGGVSNKYFKLSNGKMYAKLTKDKRIDAVADVTRYYDTKKEISKSSFSKKLKKLVGTKKKAAVKFYKNTKANRKKHC